MFKKFTFIRSWIINKLKFSYSFYCNAVRLLLILENCARKEFSGDIEFKKKSKSIEKHERLVFYVKFSSISSDV